jgi:hypothetical protein
MIEEEFYASIKFKNGEEVFAKVSVSEEDEEILLILLHPITITEMKERGSNTVGYKIQPWLKTSSDDTFIVNKKDIITVSESNNQEIIMAYNSYVRQVSNDYTNYSKINRKMGYIGSIDEAKIMLERIFKST